MKLTACSNGCGVVLPAPKRGEPEPMCGACSSCDDEGREKRRAEQAKRDEIIVVERNYD